MKILNIYMVIIIFLIFADINSDVNNANEINKEMLKNKFDIFFNSKKYKDVIFFIKKDSSEAFDYLNRLKEVYESYKKETDTFVLKGYVSKYSNLVILLNRYKAYHKCIRIDLPEISIENLIKCDKPHMIFKSLNIEDNKKNSCYMFYIFRNLVGFGSHNKSYEKYKEKFKNDEYFNFLEELRVGYGNKGFKKMPYDSLEKVMSNINGLSKDAYIKLMYVDYYYFSDIIYRFTLLYLFEKQKKENKIFNNTRFTKMLDFFCRDQVRKFWDALLDNIHLWKHCQHQKVDFNKSILESYIKLTEKWEKMQKEKNTSEKDE